MRHRSWVDVYQQLLLAADNKKANDLNLKEFLYMPEPQTPANKWDVISRRYNRWGQFRSNHPKQLMLMIASVAKNGIIGYDYGGTFTFEEIEDACIWVSKDMYKNIISYFALEFALWGKPSTNRLVVAATFAANSSGVGNIEHITFMPTTEEWIPIETSHEFEVITRLIQEKRSFEKILRYNFPGNYPMANVLLLDTMPLLTEMYIVRETKNQMDYKLGVDAAIEKSNKAPWRWNPMEGTMPDFPESILGPSVIPYQGIRVVM
jgi:hypothetical protein